MRVSVTAAMVATSLRFALSLNLDWAPICDELSGIIMRKRKRMDSSILGSAF